ETDIQFSERIQTIQWICSAYKYHQRFNNVDHEKCRVNLAKPEEVRNVLEDFRLSTDSDAFFVCTTDGRILIRPDSLVSHIRMTFMLVIDPNQIRRRLKLIGFVSEKLVARDQNGKPLSRHFWIGPEALLDEGQ